MRIIINNVDFLTTLKYNKKRMGEKRGFNDIR